MTSASVLKGQRFVMLDFFRRELACWQVVHTVLMPSGRQRTSVLNLTQPGDMLDIYADELLDPARFIPLDGSGRKAAAPWAQLAA